MFICRFKLCFVQSFVCCIIVTLLQATGGGDSSIRLWSLNDDDADAVAASEISVPNKDGGDFPRNICLMSGNSLVMTTNNGLETFYDIIAYILLKRIIIFIKRQCSYAFKKQ